MIGFLSPKGEFFKCEPYEHLYYAEEICAKYYQQECLRRLQAEDYLLSKEWIVFRARDIYNARKGITIEQFDFLNKNLKEIATNDEKRESLNELLVWNDIIRER